MALLKILLGAALLYVAVAETCPGHYTPDVLGIKVWVPAFDCPTLVDSPGSKFCCGTKDIPHCCSDCTQSITSVVACITGGTLRSSDCDAQCAGDSWRQPALHPVRVATANSAPCTFADACAAASAELSTHREHQGKREKDMAASGWLILIALLGTAPAAQFTTFSRQPTNDQIYREPNLLSTPECTSSNIQTEEQEQGPLVVNTVPPTPTYTESSITVFNCPNYSDGDDYEDQYCCGTSNNPYCCDSCFLSQINGCEVEPDSYFSMSTGAIVGIVVGSLAFIAIVIARTLMQALRDQSPTTTVVQGQQAAGVTVAQTTYPAQPYPQYPPGTEMTQYPPPGAQYPHSAPQYPPTGAQYPPTGSQYPPTGAQYPPPAPVYAPPGQQPPYPVAQGDMAYPPPYPGQGAPPMKQ
ncbi:Shisa member 4 [Branchiostoma belcheri]|nr:Shisa member 4 [Branchiostoma belcheri]